MKRLYLTFFLLFTTPLCGFAQGDEASVRKTLDTYDQAVSKKDVETVRILLAPDLLLYEHSVRNDGAKDAFGNHLKPEILEGEGLQLSFSELRVTASADLALVTRQYRVRGTVAGRAIDSSGNETQVWKKTAEGWRILHIHYSHACPRTKAAS